MAKNRHRHEDGFILPTVLVMGFVLAIFASALIVLLTSEMRNTKHSRAKDRNAQAAEAAFQRAIAVLNDPSVDYWSMLASTPVAGATTTPTGYNSLTAYPFKEIDGVAYSISVAAGDLINTGAAHSATTLWVNKGDKAYDRTIFVDIKDLKTTRVDHMVGRVHRTTKPFILGNSGIYVSGGRNADGSCNNNLGNSWDANSFDSCNGGATTTQNPADCVGNMTGPCFDGGTDVCLSINAGGNPAPAPVATIPAAPVPTNLANISTSITLGPAATSAGKSYRVNTINLNGTDTISFDESVGPITLYVTGTIDCGGVSGFAVANPAPGCCQAEGAAIIVVGGGAVNMNGNTSFTGYMYAPQSIVNVDGGGNGVFQGIIVAQEFSITGGGAGWFHYDRCLLRRKINSYESPPLIINGWEPY